MSQNEEILSRLERVEKEIQLLTTGEEEAELRAELADLTNKLQRLRSAYHNPTRQDIANFRVKRAYRYFVDHIGFFAFLVTLTVTFYVYWRYGVGYFEDYEKISNTKLSANYYLNTGQAFLVRADFPSAESAFKTALEINPYNIEARRGLILSQVLKPEAGHRAYIPEIVLAKLDYLKTEPGFENNPLLSYFRGRVAADQDDRANARKYFQDSIDQISSNRTANVEAQLDNFIGNYIELGIINMYDGKIDEAITYLNNPALERTKPKPTITLNHLVQCYMVKGRYAEAHKLLGELYGRPPRLETLLIAGDFFRYRYATDPIKYKEDLKSARTMDSRAATILGDGIWKGAKGKDAEAAAKPEEPKESKESKLVAGVDYGQMHFVPLPFKKDAPGVITSVAYADHIDQYRALINYALSLDYALANDFDQADHYYNQALADDPFKEYRCLFVYKTHFYRNYLPAAAQGLKDWFAARADSIADECTQVQTPVKSDAVSTKQPGLSNPAIQQRAPRRNS